MEFAKRQLEKYGWSEGQGLGKHSTGIKTALKPKIKLDTAGIGHDPAKEFTNRWWEDAFNDAASNINIESTADGVKVETMTQDFSEISSVKRSKLKRDKMKYGAFMKRETLTNEGSILSLEENSNTPEDEESRLPKLPPPLSDEQLFQACGGLTAHKAARHGHKLSGKLQRVQEQEEALLKSQKATKSKKSGKKDKAQINGVLQSESPNVTKSLKRKKMVSRSEDEVQEIQVEKCVSKKKKKKRDLS